MKNKAILTLSLALLFVISNAQEEIKEFKPVGKVFGEVFGDYYYKVASTGIDSILDGKGEYKKKSKEDNAFSLRRFYLGYSYEFSEKFSAKVMFEGNDGTLINGDKRGVNIKYYYLQWNNIFPNSNLIIGAQSTPTWSRFTEKIWNYRNVEKTIMDFRGQGISNDFGISLSGKLTENKTIGYELMIGNGTAQKIENNKNKKIYASVNAKLLDKKLLLEIYFDNEKDINDKALTTIKGFIGFQNEAITIGAEPFQKTYYIGDKKTSAFGTTIFARGQVIKGKLNVLARYDMFNGDVEDLELIKIDHSYNEGFIVAGLDYTPLKNVHIIPNIWVNTYSKKDNTTYPEKDPDVVARVTFSYKF
jgi:hypothetical protein